MQLAPRALGNATRPAQKSPISLPSTIRYQTKAELLTDRNEPQPKDREHIKAETRRMLRRARQQ